MSSNELPTNCDYKNQSHSLTSLMMKLCYFLWKEDQTNQKQLYYNIQKQQCLQNLIHCVDPDMANA